MITFWCQKYRQALATPEANQLQSIPYYSPAGRILCSTSYVKCTTLGKPPTWFPSENLVEQNYLIINVHVSLYLIVSLNCHHLIIRRYRNHYTNNFNDFLIFLFFFRFLTPSKNLFFKICCGWKIKFKLCLQHLNISHVSKHVH